MLTKRITLTLLHRNVSTTVVFASPLLAKRYREKLYYYQRLHGTSVRVKQKSNKLVIIPIPKELK